MVFWRDSCLLTSALMAAELAGLLLLFMLAGARILQKVAQGSDFGPSDLLAASLTSQDGEQKKQVTSEQVLSLSLSLQTAASSNRSFQFPLQVNCMMHFLFHTTALTHVSRYTSMQPLPLG